MSYKKIDLYVDHKSRGTFDDFYSADKYKTLQDAYDANDYVEGNYVKDDDGVLYIELKNVKNPEIIKRHKLHIQRPLFGIDVLDDSCAVELAQELF